MRSHAMLHLQLSCTLSMTTGSLSSVVALSVSCLIDPSCMTVIVSHFWFSRCFRLPLCCDAPFSDSVACACCSFSWGGSRALFLSLLVWVVLCCACLSPFSWSSSLLDPLLTFCPLAWPFHAVRSWWRICNALGSRSVPFCAWGWPCGCWIQKIAANFKVDKAFYGPL